MEKIAPSDPETRSADLTAENIAQLKALFPEAFTEGKIDFDVLKQLLGGTVDDKDEKYGLNWHGKRRARQLALTPSTGTLRPCPEDSVDWDTTQNLMIEGDNLEVLKLLQKSYASKVKLIYIDPPYNTGKDFVYPDDYRDNIKNYLELTGQVDGEGKKISSNTEASGRFHTDWLNMMYPRLKLAHHMLENEGLLCINIDENESYNTRHLLNEIFGPENIAGVIVWKKGTGGSDTDFSYTHDQIIIYRKTNDARVGKISQGEKQLSSYQNPDNDHRGDWTSSDYTSKWTRTERQNLWYPIINPNTNQECWPPEQRTWAYSQEETLKNINNNLLWWGKSGNNERPRYKRFKTVTEGLMVPRSWWDSIGTNEDGSNTFRALGFTKSDFPHPKPIELIEEIIQIGAPDGGIVLDFFSGSGTTGHSVLNYCMKNRSEHRFILVQLPEPLEGATFSNVADVCVERLRRVSKKLKRENPTVACDTGFRVFKLDSSNIRIWDPDSTNLEASLYSAIEHIKEGRKEADVLYELLLKLGLELTVPIETRTFAGKTVYSVGAGTLIVCLAESIARTDVEELAQGIVAWHTEQNPAGETTCVFRDSAFENDVAKTNLAAILEQHGLTNVRSL